MYGFHRAESYPKNYCPQGTINGSSSSFSHVLREICVYIFCGNSNHISLSEMDSLLSSSLNLVFTITKQILHIGRGDKYVESTSPLFEIIFLYVRLEVRSSRGSSIILFFHCCVWQYFPLILLWGLFITVDTCTNIKKMYFCNVSQIIPLLAVLPVGVILFSHQLQSWLLIYVAS